MLESLDEHTIHLCLAASGVLISLALIRWVARAGKGQP
jgi:hypothetical protein